MCGTRGTARHAGEFARTYNNLTHTYNNEGSPMPRIRLYWCLHHGITVSMYHADPDGNQMEFQVDAYPTVDGANGFMKGPGFDANPIGVEYDPDELLQELRSGVDTATLLLRTGNRPVSPVSPVGSWRDTPAA